MMESGVGRRYNTHQWCRSERFVRDNLHTSLDEDEVLDVWDPEQEDEEEQEETGEDRGWSD
jgi:hypothetical protein